MNSLSMEPCAIPQAADLKDALQKGLGRAVQWARQRIWPDKETLLEACVNDLRYDRQCEDARGYWLWDIIDTLGWVDDFREPILAALNAASDGLGGKQFSQLAVQYARRGDERFRRALKDIVARKPDQSVSAFGEEELIALDGLSVFLFAARALAEIHREQEYQWYVWSMIHSGIEQLG